MDQEVPGSISSHQGDVSSDLVLAQCDPTLPLILAADASAYGVRAVISQKYQDNSEHPIAFGSHTRTRTEQKYAQVEKGALALVFGVKRFHQYLYSCKFTLITDHKPLMTILGPHQAIPTVNIQLCDSVSSHRRACERRRAFTPSVTSPSRS